MIKPGGTEVPMKSSRMRMLGAWAPIIVVLVLLCVPLAVRNIYHLNVLTMTGLFVILSLGLNVLFGYTGQVSLGHAGFYAIGAYATAILSTRFNVSFWVCIPISAIVCVLVGLAWSIPTLKLEGAYLTVATIGFGEIVRLLLMNWEKVTGGPMGIKGIPRPVIFGTTLKPGASYYWFVVVVAVLAYYVVRNLMKSHVGKLFVAVRDDPLAALSCGVNVARMKIIAFGLSTAFAGVAGALYAGLTGYVAPTAFRLDESIMMLAMVVVGGAASNEGAILGALLISATQELFRGMQTFSALFYGLVIVLAILFVPRGIIGFFVSDGETPALFGRVFKLGQKAKFQSAQEEGDAGGSHP